MYRKYSIEIPRIPSQYEFWYLSDTCPKQNELKSRGETHQISLPVFLPVSTSIQAT